MNKYCTPVVGAIHLYPAICLIPPGLSTTPSHFICDLCPWHRKQLISVVDPCRADEGRQLTGEYGEVTSTELHRLQARFYQHPLQDSQQKGICPPHALAAAVA